MISPRINIVLLGKIISVRTIPSSHGNLGVKKRREKEKERRKERKQQYLLTCFGGELIRPRHAWCAADVTCTLLSHIFCERCKSQKELNKRWREKQMRSTEGWRRKKVGTDYTRQLLPRTVAKFPGPFTHCVCEDSAWHHATPPHTIATENNAEWSF